MSTCQGCGVEIPPSRGPRPRKWCGEWCRKRTLYGGTCRKCGATTNGSNGLGTASDLCAHCWSGENALVWTRERIVEAIKEWAEQYGEPPAAADWNPAVVRRFSTYPERLARFRAGRWPHVFTVQTRFGSWNAAIEAAGFAPRPRDGKWKAAA